VTFFAGAVTLNNSVQGSDAKKTRQLYRFAKLFLVVSIVASIFGILHNIHAHFDPGADRHYGHVTHVHIGGRDFAVPDEYIRGPRPTEANAKQLYIWLMLPDYAPYQSFDVEKAKSTVPVAERQISVLIYDMAFTTDLAFRYHASRNGPQSIFKPKNVPDLYGLHHTLVWYSNARAPQPFINSDLYYFQGSDGKVKTFIDCTRDDPDPHRYPQCTNHDFQDGRLLYEMHYGKWNLPHWREIEDHVHSLIESFACVPTTNRNSSNLSNGAKPCPP
jgi:hypothetical protein